MENANTELPAEGNRFAPPQTHVEDVTPSGSGQLGTPGARFGAAFLDGLIVFGLIGIVAAVTGWKFWAPPADTSLLAAFGLNMALGFSAYVLVNGWLLHTRGQTVGKKLLGLRVVRTDGSRAGIARLLFVRYLLNSAFSIVPVVGGIYALVDCLLIFRASRKCLHDNLADTIVVKV